jgi:hypothetical protein
MHRAKKHLSMVEKTVHRSNSSRYSGGNDVLPGPKGQKSSTTGSADSTSSLSGAPTKAAIGERGEKRRKKGDDTTKRTGEVVKESNA